MAIVLVQINCNIDCSPKTHRVDWTWCRTCACQCLLVDCYWSYESLVSFCVSVFHPSSYSKACSSVHIKKKSIILIDKHTHIHHVTYNLYIFKILTFSIMLIYSGTENEQYYLVFQVQDVCRVHFRFCKLIVWNVYGDKREHIFNTIIYPRISRFRLKFQIEWDTLLVKNYVTA